VNFDFLSPAFLRPHTGQTLQFRHLAFPLLVLGCAAVLCVPAGTRTKPSPALASLNGVARVDGAGSDHYSGRRPSDGHYSDRQADTGYVSALATANRFLQAWQNQDHESGLLMLTDDAKERSSEILMEAFFSSGADAAYEIARGKKVTAGRYTFPVTLFPLKSGASIPEKPQKSEMVVVQTGKNEWAIDRLP
jgi:hypothetical protein